MEEKELKKENNFVDNIAYKNKFQFLVWVNENVICQRYFKINGFNEKALYCKSFHDCMNSIVNSIQDDLNSKSRIYLAYTNMNDKFKLSGFATTEDYEKYGYPLVKALTDNKLEGRVVADNGKNFYKEFMEYGENNQALLVEDERPVDGEVMFKFSFLIDDKPVFEKCWDGNVYPKFVRNGVDLTNNYGNKKDVATLNFSNAILHKMQVGKQNLINEFIHRICDVLSYPHDNSENNDTDRYFTIGDKRYNYKSAFENYRTSWDKKTWKKTKDYFNSLYLSDRQIEFIDKRY